MSDYVVCHVTFLSKDGFWIFMYIELKLETFFTKIKRKEKKIGNITSLILAS